MIDQFQDKIKYLIFLYQVKNRMNAEWNKLIIDIESLNKDILAQVRELED